MFDTRNVKALIFDVDGTLLSKRTHRIPENAIRALLRAHECGLKLFIATGRHKKNIAMATQFEGLPIEGFMGLNGQFCWNRDGNVFLNPIPREDVKVFLDYIETTEALACEFLGADETFANRINAIMRTALHDVDIDLPVLGDCRRALEIDILQIVVYADDSSLAVLDRMPGCKWSRWHQNAFDIMVKQGGKWNGIKETLAHYAFSETEIIVFGDEENDIDMLENAPLSVAMENGSDSAKAAAKYVAGHIDEDGLFLAIKELLPQLHL